MRCSGHSGCADLCGRCGPLCARRTVYLAGGSADGVHWLDGLCGGGAASRLWRKIIADVGGIPVEMPAVEQGPAYGAAMLAMVACGAYNDVFEATEKIVRVKETILPDAEIAKKYNERYAVFTKLYPALKSVERLF